MIQIKTLMFPFALLGVIIIYMNAFVWGDSPKSQVDNQLITEAIAEAIVAHESDPTAHLGTGESLEQHKANEIIDHPAQSLVIDKVPFGLYDEIATIIGGSDWDPDVGNITVNGTRAIYLSLYSQTEVYSSTILPWDSEFPYPDVSLLFNFKLLMNGAQNSNGSCQLFSSQDSDPADYNRIEFIKTGTNYYWRIYVSNVKVHEYLLQAGGQFEEYIGIYFDKDNEKITLSINGLDVSSYSTADWYDLIFPNWTVSAIRTTNTSIELNVSRWKARYQLF